MKATTLWRAAKTLMFCTGLVVLLAVADFAVKPSLGTLNGWAASERTSREVDVLALGSSRTYCTILPMEMWRQAGVTALDMTGAIQIMPVTLEYLKQALETERPAVVMVELYMVGKRSTFDTTAAHKNLDYMPTGPPKTAGIIKSVKPGDWFEFFFPLQTYHSRWVQLTRRDLRLDKHTSYAYGRGAMYLPEAEAVPSAAKQDSMSEADYQRDLAIMRKMARVCRDKNVLLILFTSPSPYRLAVDGQPLLSRLQADLRFDYPSVGYLDMNPVAERLGVDPTTDYKDELHVNNRGAVKLSRWLADYLVQEYGIADRRTSELAARWDDDLKIYDKVFLADW